MLDIVEKLKLQETEEQTDKVKIAIVDDDPSFSFMLKDYLLSAAELKADLFSNGEEFLKEYHSKDERKIILDYDFGKGPDGLTVLQKIKSQNPMAVVIMVSSLDNLEKAIETIRKGATDYFLKTNKTVFANVLCSLLKIFEMERNKLN